MAITRPHLVRFGRSLVEKNSPRPPASFCTAPAPYFDRLTSKKPKKLVADGFGFGVSLGSQPQASSFAVLMAGFALYARNLILVKFFRVSFVFVQKVFWVCLRLVGRNKVRERCRKMREVISLNLALVRSQSDEMWPSYGQKTVFEKVILTSI